MMVTDINMVTRINRRSSSSLSMLYIMLTLITLLVDLAYCSVTCGSGIKSLGGKKLQSLKIFTNLLYIFK